MRLGILGGSFDPIHVGHLALARAAREALELDRVRLVPAARSPFKSEVPSASDADRLAMCRLAAAAESWLDVDDRELRRPPPSYTVDTVREIAADHPGAELFLLLGSDAAADLPDWREAETLAGLCTVAVAARPGTPLPELPPAFRLAPVPMEPVDVSSSGIRERLVSGKSVEGGLPPAVAEYVSRKRPYTSD